MRGKKDPAGNTYDVVWDLGGRPSLAKWGDGKLFTFNPENRRFEKMECARKLVLLDSGSIAVDTGDGVLKSLKPPPSTPKIQLLV
jgi:hypothetical protein